MSNSWVPGVKNPIYPSNSPHSTHVTNKKPKQNIRENGIGQLVPLNHLCG